MSTVHYLQSLATVQIGRTESDIQSDIKGLLIAADLNLTEVSLEEQIADGTRRRIDVSVGATVIEVKKSLTTLEQATNEIQQLSGYVRTRIEQTGTRYNGILTDGITWWLFEAPPTGTHLEQRAKFTLTASNGDQLIEWLKAVFTIPSNITPTATTIERYLGAGSSSYAQDAAYLKALYKAHGTNPTTQLKRGLWARLLRSALGTGFEDDTDLFIDHTLLVIEAMAIGHAVMGVRLPELASDPTTMLSGAHFEDAGLRNFMEAGFFDWVQEVEYGHLFLSKVIHRINMFNWLDVEHDVLKILYESIINSGLRKSLGEYYTPDYLAQGVIQETITDPLNQRVLDPACGSGTFIFHTIRHMLSAADAAGYSTSKKIEHIQHHVFGLDIHPVSILLARVTYLLALGDLLQAEDRPELWAQIYLGDSVQWHHTGHHVADTIRIDPNAEAQDLTISSDEYGASTLFEFAQSLVFPLAGIDNADSFDRLITDLTNTAKTYTDVSAQKPSCAQILRAHGITNPEDKETLTETFKILCNLNAEGRDSIWGYYVRNQVRPLWLSMPSHKVNVLVGNPPWVAYRFMTENMQKMFKTFCQDRNLWAGGKQATQQDLVALFIARTVEKYLAPGGVFGFVTPHAVLSRGQYEGFRAGNWGGVPQLRCKFTSAWDLDKLRPAPFPVPAGVVFGKAHIADMGTSSETLEYGWINQIQVYKGLRSSAGWAETLNNVTVTEKPVSTTAVEVSPYKELMRQGATIVPRFLFFYAEQPSTNSLGMASGNIKISSYRTSQEKQPWKNLNSIETVIPKKYLHDVHLGSTVVPFGTLRPWRAALPVVQGTTVEVEAINPATDKFGAWWKQVSNIWEENKTRSSKLNLFDRLNYQRGLSTQLPLAHHRVVYSKSGNTLVAARLENNKTIIDHSLYWASVRSKQEALYLVGVLNSPITTSTVEQYQSRGLFGARHFDTYVWNLPIPTYREDNELHKQIVELAQQCEGETANLDLSELGFQAARKKVRTHLLETELLASLNEKVKALFAATASDR